MGEVSREPQPLATCSQKSTDIAEIGVLVQDAKERVEHVCQELENVGAVRLVGQLLEGGRNLQLGVRRLRRLPPQQVQQRGLLREPGKKEGY